MESSTPASQQRWKRDFRVAVSEDEAHQIRQLAAATRMPISTYLRNVGLGYQVRGLLDHMRVEQLAKINGDLGRLGGLLKLWLTNDVRTEQFGEPTIRAVLWKIEDSQADMQQIMRSIVMPRKNVV